MTTRKVHAASVSPERRRPSDETLAATSQNPLKQIPDVQVKSGQHAPRRKFRVAYKLAYACNNALARYPEQKKLAPGYINPPHKKSIETVTSGGNYGLI